MAIRLAIKKLIVTILSSIVIAGLCILAAIGFQWVVNMNRPESYWLTYEDLSLAPRHHGRYVLGTPLVFKSTYILHLPLVLRWDDTLFCSYDDGTTEYIQSLFGPALRTPRYSGYARLPAGVNNMHYEISGGIWTWGGKLPSKTGECYLHGGPTWSPSPFVKRTLDVYSNWFKVVDEYDEASDSLFEYNASSLKATPSSFD